jgi:hypothetical protein
MAWTRWFFEPGHTGAELRARRMINVHQLGATEFDGQSAPGFRERWSSCAYRSWADPGGGSGQDSRGHAEHVAQLVEPWPG